MSSLQVCCCHSHSDQAGVSSNSRVFYCHKINDARQPSDVPFITLWHRFCFILFCFVLPVLSSNLADLEGWSTVISSDFMDGQINLEIWKTIPRSEIFKKIAFSSG